VDTSRLADHGFAVDLRNENAIIALLQDRRLPSLRTQGPRSETFDAFIVSIQFSQPGK
jgi:hypothetical protein